MEVVKKQINNYDLYIYDTKKYPMIRFTLVYEIPYTKRNIYMCDLLDEYMLYSCKKYPTRKEIHDKSLEMYSMRFGIRNVNVGEKMFVEVRYTFYDPELVGEDYLYEALKFGRDLLELNACDGTLANQEELEFAKQNILSLNGRSFMNNHYKASSSHLKGSFPNTYITEDILDSKEELEKLLDSFTNQDLIDMYKAVFENSFVGAFLMGNIKDEYLSYIEELYNFEPRVLDTNYNRELEIRVDEYYNKVQDKDYKESILRLVFKAPASTYKEKMTYHIISRMLDSDGLILHKILRDKYKLVYHNECRYSKYTNILTLIAYIDKENEEKTMDAFDEVIEMLKDEKLVEELLAKVKESIDISVYTQDENPISMRNEMITVAYGLDVSTEEYQKTINSILVADIMKSLKKLEKVKVHFYEGVK